MPGAAGVRRDQVRRPGTAYRLATPPVNRVLGETGGDAKIGGMIKAWESPPLTGRPQLAGRDDDRVTAVLAGRLECRLQERRRVERGPRWVVLGAFVDAGQVADKEDGPVCVLVVAAGEPGSRGPRAWSPSRPGLAGAGP
jgi:hypothetical protein